MKAHGPRSSCKVGLACTVLAQQCFKKSISQTFHMKIWERWAHFLQSSKQLGPLQPLEGKALSSDSDSALTPPAGLRWRPAL